jgi:hypothetical protein
VPRLSILIPFLGNRDSLENTLASVLQNRPAGTEIVVALGREYDDPYDIDEEVRFLRVEGRRNPIEIINEGFRACLAPIVHVLACGAAVSEGWTDAAVAHFGDRQVASVAPLIADADRPGRLLAAGLEYLSGGAWRHRGRGLRVDAAGAMSSSAVGPALEAGFYRRLPSDGARGPFDPTLEPNAAAVDLSLRFKQAGNSTVVDAESLVCLSPAAQRRDGAFSEARSAERLFWRHAASHGWLKSCAAHGPVAAGAFFQALPRPAALAQLIGRLLAACEWGYHRRQRLAWKLPAPSDATSDLGNYRLDRPHGDRDSRTGDAAHVPAGSRGRSNSAFRDNAQR